MRAGLWLAFLLAASPVAAQEQAPLTYGELRTLPDEALARRLFGALAPDIVLSLRLDWPSRPSLMQRASIWAWTRPRPSYGRGLCETDRSVLSFERDLLRGSGLSRENPAMRLVRIETKTQYIVLDRALAEGRTQPDPDRPGAWAAGCDGLDPRRDSVPADSPYQLMRAYALVNELGAAARAGRAHVPLDCSHMRWPGPQPIDEAECLRALRHLGNRSVGWVSECRGIPVAANCIRVLDGEIFIEFSLNQGQQPIAIAIRGVEDNRAVE
ncbi:MAG TPA: hypothetical protein VMS43_02730 [Allosphingosinicella sp.]|nr:hypothetical protein [Allosphingosinicella sp.]